jgi:hypothetical protein
MKPIEATIGDWQRKEAPWDKLEELFGALLDAVAALKKRTLPAEENVQTVH